MSFMFEVLYKPPTDARRERVLTESVQALGGILSSREEPDSADLGPVALTYEFEELTVAERAAECLRSRGEHVEGPVNYGD
jgi:hypothetical protein